MGNVPPTVPQEARLRLALEAAELGVWEWDVGTHEWRWDARAAELHALDGHLLRGPMELFLGRIHPDDLVPLEAAVQAALAPGTRFLQEFRVLRPDGSITWVQSRGAVHRGPNVGMRLVGVSADTTALRAARERAGQALEHVSEGVVVLDPNWRVVFANAQAARLVHRDVDQMIGRVLWEQFPEAVGTRVEDAYRRAVRTQEPQRIEAYYDRLGGWFEAQVFPSPDGLTVSFRNIDDRRAADEERASLIAQLTASLSRSRQLLGLTRALAGALTLDQVADLVTAHTRGALGSVFAGIAIMDDDDATLRYVSMAPLPDDVARTWTAFPLDTPVPAADSVRRAQQLLFPDRAAIVAAYPHIAEDLERAGTEAMATVPLVASGKTIGSLMLTWSEPRTCDEEERRFLDTLAGQCAQAIERSRLFARQRSVAETLQRAILPQRLPVVPGFSLAARYEPAGHGVDVGGDWYDAFELPCGRLMLVVGDVGGHGVHAAATMGQLRNAARAYALDGHPPGALVTRLSGLLAHSSDETYATVVCALVTPDTGHVRWSSAGHLPPLHAGDNGSVRLLEQVHGPLLGADPDAVFTEGTFELAEGAFLLLYTDGLVEHRTRSIDEGLAELVAVARDVLPHGREQVCAEIVDRVLAGRRREDDVCLLAAGRATSGHAV